MRLYYAVSVTPRPGNGEDLEFTNALLVFYQELKGMTSVFDTVVMMTDKNTFECMILAVSIDTENASLVADQTKIEQKLFISSATEHGVIVKINTYEATMCDDNFALMLRALNPATI